MIRPIQFTPTSKEQREEIEAYAKIKGHKNASAFALYAVIQMMSKYPLSEAQRTRVKGNHAEAEEGR